MPDISQPEHMSSALRRVLALVQSGARRERIFFACAAISEGIEKARAENNLNSAVDMLIAELDTILTRQINMIIHHDSFQRLESSWRNLHYLVQAIDFNQNTSLLFMNLSKEDLLDDFADAPEITRSGLYYHVYTSEYGQFGGQPLAVIIGNYALGTGRNDLQLLQSVTKVAAMAHAIFLTMAGPAFFGINTWEELSNLKNLQSLFAAPNYIRWRNFRESPDARYAALLLPSFLLRLPYGSATTAAMSFAFEEDAYEFKHYCWGGAAFVLAARMAASFAKYRWCVNILGPEDNNDAPRMARYDFYSTGSILTRIPVGALISERLENELAALGFVAMVLRKVENQVCFLSVNSCYKPQLAESAGSDEANLGIMLSGHIPYTMLMSRLAHYIKVIQRDNAGMWKDKNSIQAELNKWISQYITAMDDPDPVTRSRRPLRMAQIIVHDGDADSEWFNISLLIRPHIRHMGANFTLTLASRLDKKA
jgi:type VI secretion system protein ImpC